MEDPTIPFYSNHMFLNKQGQYVSRFEDMNLELENVNLCILKNSHTSAII